jgi:hypothetical protein
MSPPGSFSTHHPPKDLVQGTGLSKNRVVLGEDLHVDRMTKEGSAQMSFERSAQGVPSRLIHGLVLEAGNLFLDQGLGGAFRPLVGSQE